MGVYCSKINFINNIKNMLKSVEDKLENEFESMTSYKEVESYLKLRDTLRENVEKCEIIILDVSAEAYSAIEERYHNSKKAYDNLFNKESISDELLQRIKELKDALVNLEKVMQS